VVRFKDCAGWRFQRSSTIEEWEDGSGNNTLICTLPILFCSGPHSLGKRGFSAVFSHNTRTSKTDPCMYCRIQRWACEVQYVREKWIPVRFLRVACVIQAWTNTKNPSHHLFSPYPVCCTSIRTHLSRRTDELEAFSFQKRYCIQGWTVCARTFLLLWKSERLHGSKERVSWTWLGISLKIESPHKAQQVMRLSAS
jgi:hypothetical protein